MPDNTTGADITPLPLFTTPGRTGTDRFQQALATLADRYLCNLRQGFGQPHLDEVDEVEDGTHGLSRVEDFFGWLGYEGMAQAYTELGFPPHPREFVLLRTLSSDQLRQIADEMENGLDMDDCPTGQVTAT